MKNKKINIIKKQKTKKEPRKGEIISEKALETGRNGLYSEIIKNMLGGVNLVRISDGIIVFATPKFEKIFGYGPGEIIGKHVSILNAPTDKKPEEIARGIIEILLKTGEWHGEVNNIKKDGTLFWCYANISTFKHPDHGMVWISNHIDITDRKNAEELLRKSQSKFRSVYNQSPVAIELYDSNGLLIDANPKCLEIFGVGGVEKIKGFRLFDDPNISGEIKKTIILGKTVNFESEFDFDVVRETRLYETSKYGKIHINCTVSRLEIPGEQPGYLVHIIDITKRKQAEANLRESEERYRTLVENIGLGVILVDKDHRIVMANSEFCKRIGLSRDKVNGRYCYEFCVGRNFTKPECPGTKAMVLRDSIKVESEVLSVDGRYMPVMVHAFPVFGPDNSVNGFIEISEDISIYKKVEQVKKNLIRDLSHGLKTPVATAEMAFGLAEKSLDTGDKESLRKAHRIAAENLKRLRKDIKNILDEFSIDVHKDRIIKKENTSLTAMMEKIANNVRLVMDQRGLELEINLLPEADNVKIEKRDLDIILNNLFDNAIKFTSNGKISIKSKLENKMVVFEVKDTGLGISSKDINRVFDKFYRGQDKVEGTGLGLSICKELVEMYKGEINIYSEGVGKGTMVVVKLPAA